MILKVLRKFVELALKSRKKVVKTNIALKAELSILDGKEGKSSFYDIKENSFDRNAALYQVAVEWVF